jgi:porphobilinogen synthase
MKLKRKWININKMKRRPRRLRKDNYLRDMISDISIKTEDLIYPYFIVEGNKIRKEIKSMEGVYHFSIDMLLEDIKIAYSYGIKAIILFGVPSKKDEFGKEAYNDDGIVQRAIKEIKKNFPKILVIADVCLCEYTSHGHCGVIENNKIINDKSVELIVKSALSFAKAGADIVAPSDMMDGRVGEIRKALDENGYDDVVIMSYSAKYSSSFYGPFRDAAHSAPAFGDRKTYQMDYRNKNEALMEVNLDIDEGADIVMVKPALSYLDIIKNVSEKINLPLAAYNVSGEYSMVKLASREKMVNEKDMVFEILTSIKRAGANLIITYHALDVAKWIYDDLRSDKN